MKEKKAYLTWLEGMCAHPSLRTPPEPDPTTHGGYLVPACVIKEMTDPFWLDYLGWHRWAVRMNWLYLPDEVLDNLVTWSWFKADAERSVDLLNRLATEYLATDGMGK